MTGSMSWNRLIMKPGIRTSGMFGSASNRYGSVCGPKGLSVFAVDPGETTGWAWACVAYSELLSVRSGGLSWSSLFERLMVSRVDSGRTLTRFACGQVEIYRGPMSGSSSGAVLAMAEAKAAQEIFIEVMMRSEATRAVTRGSVSWVTDLVIEDFILRERTKSRNLLAPVRLTAGLMQEALNWERLIGVTLQSASDAKSVVTDDRLRSLGLWQVGQVHARDACRHLALFLRRLTAD